jgi:hypothetical protein
VDRKAGRREQAAQVVRQLTADVKGEPQQCPARYVAMLWATEAKDKADAARHAQVLVQNPGCDGYLQRLLLAERAKSEHKPAEAMVHLRAAHAFDPGDGVVLREFVQAASQAGQQLAAERKAGKPAGDDWLGAIAAGRQAAEVRALLREVLRMDPNAIQPAALLGRLAWADVRAGEVAAAADVALAALSLEACEPAGRDTVLYEARAAVAQGRPLVALLPYRLAAERSLSASDRAEVWCELAETASRAARPDEAGEAKRRCEAERGGQPATPDPGRGPAPVSPPHDPDAEG